MKTTDKYTVEITGYDKEAWESVKESLKEYYDITEDDPEPFILTTNNNGEIRILKFNTPDEEIIFVSANDTYVCKR